MIIVRLIASIVAYVVANAAVFWVCASVLPIDGQGFIASLVAIIGGIAGAWYVWTHRRWSRGGGTDSATMSNVINGALVVGAIGFCGGFFGPMIFAPEANQGPMLGIFITGPLGVLAGAVGGFVYALTQRRS
jgi:hypothetical protein